VTEAITLYAKWTVAQYTVSFNSQDGSSVTSQTINHGGLVTTPTAPTKTGHEFGGWYKEALCNNVWTFESDTVTEAITLYAKWTVAQYTVSFDSQEGSDVSSQTINHGGSVTEPAAPVRPLYVFAGWYKEAVCTTAWNFTSDTVTEATTLYAKWTALESMTVNDFEATDNGNNSYNGQSNGGTTRRWWNTDKPKNGSKSLKWAYNFVPQYTTDEPPVQKKGTTTVINIYAEGNTIALCKDFTDYDNFCLWIWPTYNDEYYRIAIETVRADENIGVRDRYYYTIPAGTLTAEEWNWVSIPIGNFKTDSGGVENGPAMNAYQKSRIWQIIFTLGEGAITTGIQHETADDTVATMIPVYIDDLTVTKDPAP
jgi:uncharacterized repeat protein (TIGR02543 family)